MKRRHVLRSLLACAPLLPAWAHAQASGKPINLVVSFPAGGNSDLRSRQLSQEASRLLGQAIVVENKAGASGNIGHEFVARAPADGSVLGMGAMGPLAVNAAVYPRLGFDPARDFTPIVLIEKAPLVLVTRSDKPYRTLADLVAAARARAGQLSIANAGPGGAHHLCGELFKQQAQVDMLAVPYKGGGPASNALLAGEVDVMFEQTYAALPSLQAGRTRALAVTSDRRLPSLPEVPTMAELGFAQVSVSNWLGLIGPKGLSPAMVKRLNEAFNSALAQPELRQKITGPGNEAGGGTPEQFAAFIAAEQRRWAQVVKTAGIRLE